MKRLFGRRKKPQKEDAQIRVDAVLIYDKETVYHNCTVQVLENTVTGDVSVGWWREEGNEA